jgi:Mg/Co/Ni transporter MgtE
MSANTALALEYINARPQSAARQLEAMEAEHTAAFLRNLPGKSSSLLIPAFLPQYFGQVCLHQESKESAELLASSDVSYVAAVLRHLPANQQNSILGHLAPSIRAQVLLLLTFQEEDVGSWMNTSVATLPDDSDIESARKYLKLGESAVQSDRLFVVNRDRNLVGHVSQIELTRSKKKQALREILIPRTDALLARMPVQTAMAHPSWSEADIMPVNNRKGNFVGVIRHVDLRKAVDSLSSSSAMPTQDNPLQGLAQAYGNTFLTLFNTLEDIVRDSSDRREKP